MYYIKSEPINSNYGNPQSTPFEGAFVLPEELLNTYIATMGFATLQVEEGVITSVETNQEAYDEYQAAHPPYVPSPAERREHEYETTPCISWGGEQITVDQANQKWSAYTAEGDVEIAQELTALIADAKANIRKQIPDEE